jgi:TolB-like protein/Flp pilus assembly protein TadD
MPAAAQAVFISYASQDAEVAGRIANALRAGGIEVWLDQTELRGGDAWDQKIRREIQTCALFIPVISTNTVARHEGYFRLEWDLADQRSHMIARNRAFILPVCVDSTSESAADTPESFRRVQWTRLPAGDTGPDFVTRIELLLAGAPTAGHPPAHPQASARTSSGRRFLMASLAVLILAAALYVAVNRGWMRQTPVAQNPVPSAHSIAVLPFINMSGDKEQEYFSDGLTEEVLNSLAQINGLQVAGRTSSFYFKGKGVDLETIAHKLGVADVLEGSVRRSAGVIRVTAQLTNAVTGFQVWSKTYDRETGDVLKLQTEIARAVAEALKVTLLGDFAAKIELGGTHNPAAFDSYLRASKAYQSRSGTEDIPEAIRGYTDAIDSDPSYALAWAARSLALSTYAAEVAGEASKRESFSRAEADARKAIALTPGLAEAHLALATFYNNGPLELTKANAEFERALTLAPGNARVLRISGGNAAYMGHFDVAIPAARRAVLLDPLARSSHTSLGLALYLARRYQDAAAAYAGAVSLNPDFKSAYAERGLALYAIGDLQGARASCEAKRDFWYSHQCLAIVYDKLDRHADAEAELANIRTAVADAAAYQYATIYAQWGDPRKALEALGVALKLRDPGLFQLKTEPLLDPLRQEPGFKAILDELKFPD